MANLGASVGGVADSFLKAFTTLNNDYRANEEAERLKAALALEQAQAEKERQAVAEWIAAQQANKTQKTGFLETPTGKPVNSNLKAFEMTLPAGTPDAQVNQVAAGLANKQIPIPQGGGQFGMMSDQNDLKDLYMKLAAVNPRKYLNLLQKDDSGYDKLMAQKLMAEIRGESTNRRIDEIERHNRMVEYLRSRSEGNKKDDTATKDSRKEKIAMFNDAIKQYDKNIDHAEKMLNSLTANLNNADRKAYKKSISDNQQQKAIAIARKNAFISGQPAPQTTTTDDPLGIRNK